MRTAITSLQFHRLAATADRLACLTFLSRGTVLSRAISSRSLTASFEHPLLTTHHRPFLAAKPGANKFAANGCNRHSCSPTPQDELPHWYKVRFLKKMQPQMIRAGNFDEAPQQSSCEVRFAQKLVLEQNHRPRDLQTTKKLQRRFLGCI
jgi:hypothetical protein